jgi:hypothetical protein
MKTTNLGCAGVLLAVFTMACTLNSSGLSQAASAAGTGGQGGTASSGSSSSSAPDDGDTQSAGTGGQSCTTAADCPGSDTYCRQRVCQNGTCTQVLIAGGTALPSSDQAQGDCQQQECDGNGEIVGVALEADIPPDDGRECTEETCEGTTPLNKPLVGNACGTASCAGFVWTPPSSCGGQGECNASAPMDCAPYQCDATVGCKSSCQGPKECASGFYCSASACVPQLTAGQACASPDACLSGFCVDQVCCSSECVGVCRACKAALTGMSNGQCGNATAGTDPHDDCPGTLACLAGGMCSM